ncbi:phage tail protein [Serratia proteamaculans]|uniref:phage tail protein n=1 Tax=Serratia proteamaculans TaxID=28151 RepID=UPI00217889E9|nr:phage tail protein [Serratia proteamaculans]CAI1574000.1 Phage tail fibre repeat [Serratia proteamaculans]
MSKYKAIITTAGAAKIAAASTGGTQLKITRMAVGDGNGTLPTPNPAQTKLINEKYRATLNGLTIDKSIKNHIVAELVVPASVGGFWLREMGLYDDFGTLIAVSNMAESYKPKLEEGSGRTQTLRMILIVSSSAAISVIAGGDTVLATKDFVADAIKDHEKTRNHPDASTTAKGLVQLSSATTSADETKAATPKAVKVVNDASAKKSANLSDLTDKSAARGNLALGSAATKNVGVEGGQVMAVGAFGLGAGARAFDNAYCNTAQIYRVNSTSQNKPPISGNIAAGVISLPCDAAPSAGYVSVSGLGHGFIGASNRPENGVKWSRIYTTDYKPTAADVGALTDAQAVQKYVQRSIKVNGKPLSGDVNLLAGDVNAWNKTEADGRFVKRTGDTMTGQLTLPRLAFPSESAPPTDGDNDLTRQPGFTLEQLGEKSKNYPLTKNGGLGNLMSFKLNRYRNVQFAVGSGNNDFWLRSMRDDDPASVKAWAQVYTTDYKPTITDVQAADHRNNFAARMGVQRVLTGADTPTTAGVWSVENSKWTPVSWGSLYVTSNQTTLSTEPGNQRFIHYLFIGHGNGNKLYAATNNNGSFSGWSQYYSTAGKPTAEDVGALTDAQAAQKYAMRSYKVNGKPLSGDINLLAGDINAWNKTEADGRYLMKTGGQLTGPLKTSAEIQSTTADNYRLIGGDYGTFWRNDGNSLYLLLTKSKDQYGTFNDFRPFAVDVKTGNVSFGHNVGVTGELKTFRSFRADKGASIGEDLWVDRNAFVAGNLKVGNTTYQTDGNINGAAWGGYLSNWLNDHLNGRVDWNSFNNRSHISGNRNAWWYKDELTGYIHQGGVINRGDNYLNRVNFPRGFTQDCFGVQLTLAGHWGDSSANMEALNVGPGGFDSGMNGNERIAFWWAVGV